MAFSKCNSYIHGALSYQGIVIMFVLLILGRYLQHIVVDRSKKSIKRLAKFQQYGAASVFTFYAMTLGFSLGAQIPICLSGEDAPNEMRVTIGFYYGCGLFTLLTIFMHRFSFVIRDSRIISPSKLVWIKKYIEVMIILLVFSFCATMVFYVIEVNDSGESDCVQTRRGSADCTTSNDGLQTWRVFGAFCGAIYLIVSFSELTLFIYSLFQIGRLLVVFEKKKQEREEIIKRQKSQQSQIKNTKNVPKNEDDEDDDDGPVPNVDRQGSAIYGADVGTDNTDKAYDFNRMGSVPLTAGSPDPDDTEKQRSDIAIIDEDGGKNNTQVIAAGDSDDDGGDNTNGKRRKGRRRKKSAEWRAKMEAKREKKVSKLIENMTAYTLLVSIGLFSTFLNGIAWSVFNLDSMFAITNDIVINSVCLYLQFPFSRDLYSKICSFCHIGVERLFWNAFQSSAMKNNVKVAKFYESSIMTKASKRNLFDDENGKEKRKGLGGLFDKNKNKNKNKDSNDKEARLRVNVEMASPRAQDVGLKPRSSPDMAKHVNKTAEFMPPDMPALNPTASSNSANSANEAPQKIVDLGRMESFD